MPTTMSEVDVELQLPTGRVAVKGRVMNVTGRRCGIRVHDIQSDGRSFAQLVAHELEADPDVTGAS